jgi:DNA-binding LacI/PurR family transcriptional regulator
MSASARLVPRAKQPAYRRIFDGLRRQITTGTLAPGTQLPSTRDLVVTWKSSYFVIHAALTALVREGWLERRHGAGTFIIDPKRRFLCAGIYHGSDPALDDENAFSRHLHFALLREFERQHKTTQVFIDPRPHRQQSTILPALAEAIRERRIQCLVAPSINQYSQESLARLTVPTAFLANSSSPHQVGYDTTAMFRESLRRLKEQGCRSVGVITNIVASRNAGKYFRGLRSGLEDAFAEAGLPWREEWIRCPSSFSRQMQAFGYREFRAVWKMRNKPDGLIVHPDNMVRGVILAVLETGSREVAQKMKFVFHRNAHVSQLCPFPATWAILDENTLARGLVSAIQGQFDGKKVVPTSISYAFEFARKTE